MITEDCVNLVLPVVADSWDKLRRTDVFRLLDSIAYESIASLNQAGDVISRKRPDLIDEVASCCRELEQEIGGAA